jgi:quercetin 2,3-dioxygenase
MIDIRRSQDRGHADHGWLDSRHTFSFADYHDPRHMGFRALRVINEDRVAPGAGFGTHGHRDMEIVSYVLEGALEHKDSMGTGSVLRPGQVQRMSAGTGVRHSEMNGSKTEPVHFLQIWIQPDKTGIAPSYEEKTLSPGDLAGKLVVVASPDGQGGSLEIHADAVVRAGVLEPGATAEVVLSSGRHAWVQVARGEVTVNGERLREGDGAALSGEPRVQVTGVTKSEVLVFDLA